MPQGWSGSVTPTLAGYSFTPAARSHSNVTADQTGQDFTGAAVGGVAGIYDIHSDHLNTPRAITNQTSQAVWRWDQGEPFGTNPPNEDPSGLGIFTCNLRLPGQYFDKETNLHYNVARDYDPAIGRYTQSDPIGLEGGLNTYAYVENNPLLLSDPTGNFAILGAFWGPIVQAFAWASGSVGAVAGGVATVNAIQQRQANQNLGNLRQAQSSYCINVNFSDPICGTLQQTQLRWAQCTGATTAAGGQMPGLISPN